MQYQLKKLVEAGATVIFNDVTTAAPNNKVSFSPGKGRIIKSSFNQVSFEALGFQRDFISTDASGKKQQALPVIIELYRHLTYISSLTRIVMQNK